MNYKVQGFVQQNIVVQKYESEIDFSLESISKSFEQQYIRYLSQG